MGPQPPQAIRRSRILFGACVVAGLLIGALSVACWWRIGALVDAYHTLPLSARELKSLDQEAAGHRADLSYNAALGPVIAMVAAVLAVELRKPVPWPRRLGLWFAVAGAAALAVGLGSTPVDASDQAGGTLIPDLEQAARAQAGLGPFPLAGWYVSLYVVVGLITLGSLVAAAIQLSRVSAHDFSRPASHVEDEQWAAFARRQREKQARGE